MIVDVEKHDFTTMDTLDNNDLAGEVQTARHQMFFQKAWVTTMVKLSDDLMLPLVQGCIKILWVRISGRLGDL